MVAAYFALSGEGPESAAIWALNLSLFPFPAQLGRSQPSGAYRIENLVQFQNGSVPRFLQATSATPGVSQPPQPCSVVVFEAPAIVARVAAQEGLFSVGLSTDEEPIIDLIATIRSAEGQVNRKLLTQLLIPRDSVEQFREGLPIEPTTIFPDLEGIALTLRAQLRGQLRSLLCRR
jgi:hypothetical protein